MRVWRRRVVVAVLVGLLGLVALGCGAADQQTVAEEPPPQPRQPAPAKKKKKLTPIRMTLEGYPDAENIGVLMADRRGYFEDVGLDVEVLSPVFAGNVAGYVNGGTDDIGLLALPEVAAAREENEKGHLVAVGSLVPRPTMAMIWLGKSGIDGVADLAGKAIGVEGLPAEEGFLRAILEKAGLKRSDVTVKELGYRLVPALAEGRVDAILGSGNTAGVELEARGLEPVVTSVRRLGIPSYEELVVITRRDRLRREPRSIHAFMAAVARGTAAAIADPEAAADAIAETREEIQYGEPQAPALRRAKLEATFPLLSKTGRMSPRRAADLLDWMHAQGILKRPMAPAALLSNRSVGR